MGTKWKSVGAFQSAMSTASAGVMVRVAELMFPVVRLLSGFPRLLLGLAGGH